jgi:hypothetical protein
MKKLKQEQKQEENNPAAVKVDLNTTVLSSRSFFATALSPVFVPGTQYFTTGSIGKPIDRATAIFHPPAV